MKPSIHLIEELCLSLREKIDNGVCGEAKKETKIKKKKKEHFLDALLHFRGVSYLVCLSCLSPLNEPISLRKSKQQPEPECPQNSTIRQHNTTILLQWKLAVSSRQSICELIFSCQVEERRF